MIEAHGLAGPQKALPPRAGWGRGVFDGLSEARLELGRGGGLGGVVPKEFVHALEGGAGGGRLGMELSLEFGLLALFELGRFPVHRFQAVLGNIWANNLRAR
jgi:hypothetical protein